ncbi:hypothetical protein KZZ07_23460 [Mameliella sp. CS4]|uniref:hypothetical protein n=1 Tax=Mameliella sp. CS4 TaxID=2862329 RepID=UPI001C5FA53D|nr:hypothetical protein [Mameliella sp. CS4]MBW4985502.1 hypothetical protein [Mameliella sp. CS4]
MTKLTIVFAPVRREGELVLERQGNSLIANGAAYDLAVLAAEESDSPGEGWVQSVRLTEAGLEATVLLPHGADAPEAVRFPQPVTVEVDGEIAVPG